MVNAQTLLGENYPKSERKNKIELDISNKRLKGKLDLEGVWKFRNTRM